mmetsp:Transcript_3985/g.11660  ORF Transcript_3985/g.11660 Transcript_3985/m.11660 type:complete len:472 (-) Transcript_3985:10-1425(-)
MRSASPCAMEVLPTPASPTSTGLFLERRPRMRTVRFSSSARPTKGSSRPSRASCVRSCPNFRVCVRSTSSTAAPFPAAAAWLAAPCWAVVVAARLRVSSLISASKICSTTFSSDSTPMTFWMSLLPFPSFCLSIACSRCAVPTVELPWSLAHSIESSSTCFAPVVKGISSAFPPEPRPTMASNAALASGRRTLNCAKARQPTSVPSETMPTTSISVPTWSLPSLRDSACAIITALIVFSVNRSNIMAVRATAPTCSGRAPGRGAEALATEAPRNAEAPALRGAPQLLAREPGASKARARLISTGTSCTGAAGATAGKAEASSAAAPRRRSVAAESAARPAAASPAASAEELRDWSDLPSASSASAAGPARPRRPKLTPTRPSVAAAWGAGPSSRPGISSPSSRTPGASSRAVAWPERPRARRSCPPPRSAATAVAATAPGRESAAAAAKAAAAQWRPAAAGAMTAVLYQTG